MEATPPTTPQPSRSAGAATHQDLLLRNDGKASNFEQLLDLAVLAGPHCIWLNESKCPLRAFKEVCKLFPYRETSYQ
jgi:hypothetical protein